MRVFCSVVMAMVFAAVEVVNVAAAVPASAADEVIESAKLTGAAWTRR